MFADRKFAANAAAVYFMCDGVNTLLTNILTRSSLIRGIAVAEAHAIGVDVRVGGICLEPSRCELRAHTYGRNRSHRQILAAVCCNARSRR